MTKAYRKSGLRSYPVKAAAVLLGAKPALLDAGLLTPVSGGSGLCVGVVKFNEDNSAGANGAVYAAVEGGEHKLVNAGDVVIASVGTTAYFVDEDTVSIDDNGAARPAAGKITQVDSDGVWVVLSV